MRPDLASLTLTGAACAAAILYLVLAAADRRPRSVAHHGLHALMAATMAVTAGTQLPASASRALAAIFGAATGWLTWRAACRLPGPGPRSPTLRRCARPWYDVIMAASMTWMTAAQHGQNQPRAHLGHAAGESFFQLVAVVFLVGSAWLAARATLPARRDRAHAVAGCLMSLAMTLAYAAMAGWPPSADR